MNHLTSFLLAAWLFAGPAAAAPSLWDRIRDPGGVKAESALLMAVQAREEIGIPSDDLGIDLERALAMRAAIKLELRGGEELGTPAVWFFLGNALVVADRGREEDARRILRRALAADPESPQASRAWFDLAIASNRLLDFATERDAYGEALRLQWNRGARAQIHLNRGESSMSLGRLAEARRDYETSLALADAPDIHALAAWGLAVAFARDDDLPTGLEYAWKASTIPFPRRDGSTLTAVELPGVFFTPAYEIFYYRALAAMAAFERADGTALRQAAVAEALRLWKEYLSEARAHGDRWVENAEHQERWCERRLSKK